MSKERKPAVTKAAEKPKKQKAKVERYLTEDELSELKETFDLFDDDKSGTIDAKEISKVLEDLGLDQRNPIVFAMV
jgi:Ca2+-binding EF-hand superfamily protein